MSILGHGIIRQPNRQSSTVTSFTDVAGASIPSTNFTPGKEYLLLVTGFLDSTDANKTCEVRVVHGGTQFPGTEHREEPDTVTSKVRYFFWHPWVAEAGEDVILQIKADSGGLEIGISEIDLLWLCLSDDLVKNVDWFHDILAVPTALSDAETAENNASITIVPAVAGQKWLIMSRAENRVDDLTVSYQSRLLRTGEATETLSEVIKEGEDPNSKYLQSQIAVLTLGAVPNTFTEKSLLSGVTAAGTEIRQTSAVFALNLSKFKQAEIARTAAKTDLSAAAFGTLLETVSITPTAAGDVWSMGYWVHDVGASGVYGKTRLQVDNADDPAGQTTDSFPTEEAHDARDQMAMVVQTLSSKTAAPHTYDLDASTSAALAGRGGMYRSLFAVTMELAEGDTEPPPSTGQVDWIWSNVLPLGTETTGGELAIDADTLTDDDLYVEITSRGHDTSFAPPTVEDDDVGGNLWLQLGVVPGRKAYLLWKKATENTAGKTIVIAGAINSCAALVSCYRGGWRGGNPTTNLTIEQHVAGVEQHAEIIPAFANSMICLLVSNHPATTQVTSPQCAVLGPLTPRAESLSTGGDNCAIYHASAPQVGGPAATGLFSWIQDNTVNRSMVWAIRPEPTSAPPPEQTDAQCKDVAFNIGTGIAGSTVEVPVGFAAKAVKFFGVGRTEANDAAGRATRKLLVGFAADCAGVIKNRCGAISSKDNEAVATWVPHRTGRTDSCLVALDDGGNVLGRARLTSFTADSFVLTIDVQFSSDLRFIAQAFGGADLSDCAIGTFATATATGLQDVTGLGFTCVEGQAVGFLLGVAHTADNVVSSDAQLGFGAFVKARDGVFWTGATDDGAITVTRRHCSRGRPWASLDASASAFGKRVQFEGWITDGFRLNHEQANSDVDAVYYLVLKGGRWALADGVTSLLNAGVQLTGLGIGRPVGGLLVSAHAREPHEDEQVGFTDLGCFGTFSSPTSRHVVAWRDDDGVDPSVVATRIEHDQLYVSIGSSGVATAAMDLESFDSDGLTFHQDQVEQSDDGLGTRRFFWCVLFGRSAGFVGDPQVGHEYWRARLKRKGNLSPPVNQLELVERRGRIAAPGSTVTHPAQMHPGIKYIAPVILANQGPGSGDGIWEIDEMRMGVPVGYVPSLGADAARYRIDTLLDEEGILKPTVRQNDGAGPLPLNKGTLLVTAKHGQVLLFQDYGRVFQTVPKWIFQGGIQHEPRNVWGSRQEIEAGIADNAADPTVPQYEQFAAMDLYEGGCTVEALLRRPAASGEALKSVAWPNTHLVALDQTVELGAHGELVDVNLNWSGRFTVRVNGQGNVASANGALYSVSFHYVIETSFDAFPGPGTYQIRSSGIFIFETTSISPVTKTGQILHSMMVNGITNDQTDRIRIRIIDIVEEGVGAFDAANTWIQGEPSAAYPTGGVNYLTGSAVPFANKTPGVGDLIDCEFTGYV